MKKSKTDISSSKFSSSLNIWPFLLKLGAVQFILPVIFTSPVITYDSQGYLSSAKAILTKEFESYYIFFRSPGYPLFLKSLLEFTSGSFRFVIIVQSAFVSISTICLLFQIFHFILNNQHSYIRPFKVIAIISTMQIGIIGYAAAALQQSIFVIFANFTLAFAIFSNRNYTNRHNIYWSLIFLIGYSISPVLLIIPGTALFFNLIVFEIKNGFNLRNRLIAALTVFLILIPCGLFGQYWNSISSKDYPNNPTKTMGTTIGVDQLLRVPGWLRNSPVDGIDSITRSFISQSGLIPSTGWHGVINIDNPPIFENRTYAEEAFSPPRVHGLYDDIGNSAWVLYAKDSYRLDSAPITMPMALVCGFSVLTYIVKIASLISPLFIFILMVGRKSLRRFGVERYLLLSLPTFLFSMSYVILGAEADRYALPGLMPITIAIALFILELHNHINKNWMQK